MKDKREIIIEAASELLINENYQTMKTANLANLAGVAEGTLYRYFKNKKEIFISVVEYLVEKVLKHFFADVNTGNELINNIEIIRGNIRFIVNENKFKSIVYGKVFSEIDDEEIKKIMKNMMDQGIFKIKEMFDGAKNRGEINLTNDELEIISLTFWGIADFYIRRSIAGCIIKENEIENAINFLYKAIKNNN